MSDQIQTTSAIAPLLERAQAFANNKHDSTVLASTLRFAHVGDWARLVVPGEMGSISLGMEDHALGQLGERLSKSFWGNGGRTMPRDFYRQLYGSFPGHFTNLTNDLLDKAEGKLLVRGYRNNARAILSDKYATLDNVDLLEMAQGVLDGIPFKVVESGKYYSKNDGIQRDEMSLRVMVKTVQTDDPKSPYGVGVMIKNGETGQGASEIRPLVWRHSCFNSIVFKSRVDGESQGLKLTHLGSKKAKINLLAAALVEALPMAEEGLVKFLETRTIGLDLAMVISKLGEAQGWAEEITNNILIGSEGDQSVYGVINGLTFAAHEADLSLFDRVAMETLASSYVYEPALLTKIKA